VTSLRLVATPAQPRIALHLLGPFGLTREGVPLELPAGRRRPLALLRLVAASGGRISRDELIDHLWPDSSPEAGATNLRSLLHHLRGLLGGDPPPIVVQGSWVLLNPAISWEIDLLALEQEASLAGNDQERLAAALSAYQGEPLPEDRYEDWAAPIRERVQRVWRDSASRLAENYRQAGDLPAALTWLERLLEADPLDEAAFRLLLAALAEDGRRPEARRRYREFAARLHRELEVEPEPETQAIAGRLEQADERELIRVQASSRPESALPAQPNAFIGRQRELAEVLDLLRHPGLRLLTLTGPGGTGKTRLALQAAELFRPEYEGEIVFVPLAPLSDPSQVTGAILTAVGGGRLEQTAEKALRTLLEGRTLLLLLDNCEHVVEGRAIIGDLLASFPGLTVIATSREPLHLAAEQEYPVPPLGLPARIAADPARIQEADAIAFFVQRATAVRPDFALALENAEAVVAICRRLDCLPLALELAAARLRLLTPALLLEQLARPLDFLTEGPRDAPDRHRTLRAAIEWSYALLSPSEQTLLARLSIFSGGCALEAADVVCNPKGELGPYTFALLSSLVEKSLLQVRNGADGGPRFQLLDTVRGFALERLEKRGETEQIRERHARYFAGLVERLAKVRADRPVIPRVSPGRALDLTAREVRNIDAAIAWLAAHGEWASAAVVLAAVMAPWMTAATYGDWEAADWLPALAAHLDAAPPMVQAAILISMTQLHQVPGIGVPGATREEIDRWRRDLEERAISLARSLDDPWGLMEVLCSLAPNDLYWHHPLWTNDLARAESRLLEGLELARALESADHLGGALRGLGDVAQQLHEDSARARAYIEESLAIERARGHQLGTAYSLHTLAFQAFYGGEQARALALAEEACLLYQRAAEWRQLGNLQLFRGGMALALQLPASMHAALQEFIAGQGQWYPENWQPRVWPEIVATLAAQTGRLDVAARLFGFVAGVRAEFGLFVSELLGLRLGQDEAYAAVASAARQPPLDADWRRGEAMTLDESLAYALRFLEDEVKRQEDSG
jgi:predicted ATPase/DNA-binding SARP family transcriptional activator